VGTVLKIPNLKISLVLLPWYEDQVTVAIRSQLVRQKKWGA